MDQILTPARLVDAVLVLTLLEALVLVTLYRRTGRGVAPSQWLLNLLSGLCLMAALRCAVAQAPWPWLAAWLAAAGLAHGLDLARRWQGRIRPS